METYSPREDSFLILDFVRKYSRGMVLDMGTGSGILGLEAAKYSDFVFCCDVNAEAVEECKQKYSKIENVRFLKSDLFSSFTLEKFDLIIFNPPYLPYCEQEDEDAKVWNCGGIKGYELIEKFISLAGGFLNDNGKILILFSSLTGKEKCEKIFSENKYKFSCLKEKMIADGEILYVYLLE